MEVIPTDLSDAALDSRARLTSSAAATARANAAPGSTTSQLAMAATAREAIFADALLSAIHARLEECKSVAK